MLILLGLGALWAAVLVPPLIKNQISSRSSASGIANHLDVYSVPSIKGYKVSLPQSALAAKRRRRDVSIILSGVGVLAFFGSIAGGGVFLWGVDFVVDLVLVGYVALITQRRDLETDQSSVVLTHSFITSSMEEEYDYPEAI